MQRTFLAAAAMREAAAEALLEVAAEEESVPAPGPPLAKGDSALASGVSGPFAPPTASAGRAQD